MERYTEYHCGVAVIKNKELLKEAIAKLAAYEDAEDEGRLFIFPGINEAKECQKRIGCVGGSKYQISELGKILEEIRKLGVLIDDDIICVSGRTIEFVIRKHMNDGWIPVEERLPTKEEFLKDDGRFILDDGNRRYQGLFNIYDGKFKFSKRISGINYELYEDDGVIAWQPLPEPYRPERSDNHDGE